MMRKLYLFALLTFSLIGLSHAQTDEHAKKLLNEVSKKYSGYKTMQSDFALAVKDANGNVYDNTGTMYFNKPRKQYHIALKDELIISDGKSVWNISKEIKEIQVTEAESNSSTIGPDNLFTFYQSGYKYISMPDEKITKNNKTESVKVVELSPVDTKNNYFKIKLRINNNKHIHDVTIFDKSNNRFTYTINTLYVNHKIAPARFDFIKEDYKGYEIVDLR